MQGTWVQSLHQEDPLEKAMATHSSIHACRIPWTEEPGRLRSMGSQRVGLTEQLKDNKQAEILGDQQGELWCPVTRVETNRKKGTSSFLTRTQPIKSHGLLIYHYCRSINFIFPSIKILSCWRNQSLRNQAPHSESWRTQVLRFIMLKGPEELTLQALSPEQRGYKVFLYTDRHD